MAETKIFDLEQRIPCIKDEKESFGSIEKCRAYDIDIRTSMRVPLARVISLLSKFCKDGSQMLEVSCQTGLLSLMLGGEYPNVNIYGIEENNLLFQVAEENCVLAALTNSPAKVEFQQGILTELPIENDSVDVVFSYSSLHRWADPVKTLQECARVCKPDGLVLIYDLARDAEEGMISFILQYVSAGQEEFMKSLRAAYTTSEAKKLLRDAKLENWVVSSEAINLSIASKKIETDK